MTATQEMKDEWVVYRLKNFADGKSNACEKAKWDRYAVEFASVLDQYGAELVAEGLTETQALQFVALTKET